MLQYIFFILLVDLALCSQTKDSVQILNMNIHLGRYENAEIFDFKSNDPYLGIKFEKGYLPFPQSDDYKEKTNWFLYTHNNKGLSTEEVPLLIMNPGGPCWSALIELFMGIGAYNFDMEKMKLFKNKNNALDFADVLYLELPLGAGFSKSDPYINSFKENNADQITSLEILQSYYPKLVNKKRQIYMYISSYAGIDLTFAMNGMLDNGWQLKGFLSDAPLASMATVAPLSMENLYKYGDISWIRYNFFKFLWHIDTFLYKANIFGNRAQATKLDMLPLIGLDLSLLASINDVRPKNPYNHIILSLRAKALIGSKNFQKAYDGKDQCKLVNMDCQMHVEYNLGFESADQWEKLLERGVKIVALEGKYDYPLGIKTVMESLEKLQWSKKGFNKKHWFDTEFGSQKNWKNLWVEVVDDSGHTTVQDKPRVVYKRLKQMIEGEIQK